MTFAPSRSTLSNVLLIAEQAAFLKPICAADLNELYVFHKPGISKRSSKGYVSSFSSDLPAREGPSLRDYFMQTGLSKRYPVDEFISFGRLDKDTSGLLLLSKREKHPKFIDQLLLNPLFKKDAGQTTKLYRAKVRGEVNEKTLARLKNIQIPGTNEVPVSVSAESVRLVSVSNAGTRMAFSIVELEINEGKFHQVKKMFYAIKHPVCKGGLHRVRFGMLTLAAGEETGSREMDAGEIRPLFESEKKKLVSLYNYWLISEKARLGL